MGKPDGYIRGLGSMARAPAGRPYATVSRSPAGELLARICREELFLWNRRGLFGVRPPAWKLRATR